MNTKLKKFINQITTIDTTKKDPMRLLTITKHQLTLKSLSEKAGDNSYYEKYYDAQKTECSGTGCGRKFKAGEQVIEHTRNNETFCEACA